MLKRFAAIDVGSYELTMKIFEISDKSAIKKIETVSHLLDLGTQTYSTGKLSHEKIEELCRVLNQFHKIMNSYKVDAYKAYGTSAIREARNRTVILDEIKQKASINVEILSNSEQRFLDLKAIATKGEQFESMLKKDLLVLDIGGGSIQISLFSKGSLMATSNLRLGVLRVEDALKRGRFKKTQRPDIIEELVNDELTSFKKFFLKDYEIGNLIVFDDYLSTIAAKGNKNIENLRSLKAVSSELSEKSASELENIYDVSADSINLAQISAITSKRIMEINGIENLWIPGVTLSEGIVYDYALSKKLIKQYHDFDKDILTCASNIAKRYMCVEKRSDNLEKTALLLFDSLKKEHGLNKRDRLLLQLASVLNDCGRYISLLNSGESAYSIVMSTEIIGLSHRERQMVANIVKYNHIDFSYDSELEKEYLADRAGYLAIVKMVAIIKLANGLDRSRTQKCKFLKAKIDGSQLVINIKADKDFSLEQGLFTKRALLFNEVYSLTPVIKVN